MDTSIIVAIITSLATISTVVITSISSASKTKYQVSDLAKQIEALSTKVEKHNSYDRRIVAIETRLDMMSKTDNDGK